MLFKYSSKIRIHLETYNDYSVYLCYSPIVFGKANPLSKYKLTLLIVINFLPACNFEFLLLSVLI